MVRLRRCPLIGALLVLASCTTIVVDDDLAYDENGLAYEDRTSELRFNGDQPVISLPAEVSAGSSFVMTVTTLAGGCGAPGKVQSSVNGRSAHVTLSDRVIVATRNGDPACPDILLIVPRDISLSFSERGTATIWIHGRRGSDNIVVRREITVR